jgi:hypothetical protein
MPSSEMLHQVAPVRTDVSEERIASIIRMTRIGELGTTLAVTSNRHMLLVTDIHSSPIPVTPMMKALHSSKTSVLTKATLHNITEDGIFHFEDCFGCSRILQATRWTSCILRAVKCV